MNKRLEAVMMTMLVVSVFTNVISNGVIAEHKKRIADLEDYNRRLKTWGNIMGELVITHYKSGESLSMSPEMHSKVEAYLIFRANNMV